MIKEQANYIRKTVFQKYQDRVGKLYHQMMNGMVVRVSPLKPWRGKSERRFYDSQFTGHDLTIQPSTP